MMGMVLALLAASANGLSVVLVSKKLANSHLIAVSFAVTAIGNLILWPLALLFSNLRTANLEAILLFAVAGVLAPGLGRLLYYRGIETLGVSANASVFASNSVFSSMLAILLLNEPFALENCIGIICVVIGVLSVERDLRRTKTGAQ